MWDKTSRLVVVLAVGLVDDGYAPFLRAAAEAGEGVGLPSWLVSSAPLRQGRVAPGPPAGARDEPDLGHVASRGPRQAQTDGFGLHANV